MRWPKQVFSGPRLLEVISQAGRTVHEVAYETGIGEGRLNGYIDGDMTPPIWMFARIAAELDMSMDHLFAETFEEQR